MASDNESNRILYAGDDATAVRDAVGLLPDSDSLSVLSVGNQEELRGELERDRVACLVCDQQVDSGPELLSALRETHPELPILFVVDDRAAATDAVDAGATDVFVRRSAGDGAVLLAQRLENLLARRRLFGGREPVGPTPAESRSDDPLDEGWRLADDDLRDLLLDTLNDVFYLLDSSGHLVRWNEQFRAVTGYSDEELAGMHALDFFEGDSRNRVATAIETVLEDGTVTVEAPFVTKDDERIPFDWTGALLTDADGEPRGIVGIGRNISERKERERRLLELRESVETITSYAPIVLFAYDSDGVLTRLQAQALRGLELEVDPDVGDSVLDVFADNDRVVEQVQRSLDGDGVHKTIEIAGRTFESWHEPMLDENGAVDQVVGVALDITERVNRQRELEQERDRLTAIYDATPYPFVHVEFDGDEPIVRRANDAFEEVFGYDESTLVGRSLDQRIVPEWESDAKEINMQARRGESIEREVTRKTADGETREFLFRATTLSGRGDTVEGVAAYVDITDRKRRIEQLRQIRQNASEVIWMSSPEKDAMEFVSNAYEDIWGRSTESLYEEPESFVDAIHPEDRDRIERALDRQRETPDTYEETYRIVRPDGEVRWVHDRASGVYDDGELTRIVGVASDITERKEREQELKVRTRAMEEAPIGITIHDAAVPDCSIAYVNDGFQTLTGYDASVVEGGTLGLLAGANTDDGRFERVETAFERGEHVSEVLLLHRSDSSPFWGRISLAPVTTPDGETTHFVGFLQDVTETKEHEQQIQRRLNEFGELLAEDLRHPLQEARDGLETAKDSGDPGDIEETERALKQIDSMIDDLATVHSDAVKSRDVFDGQRNAGGSR